MSIDEILRMLLPENKTRTSPFPKQAEALIAKKTTKEAEARKALVQVAGTLNKAPSYTMARSSKMKKAMPRPHDTRTKLKTVPAPAATTAGATSEASAVS